MTAYICLMGSIESTIVALFIERGNPSAWSIHLDSKLLAAVYAVRLIILILYNLEFNSGCIQIRLNDLTVT